MLSRTSALGAKIVVKLNGNTVADLQLAEDEQLSFSGETYFLLQSNDTVEYTENDVTRTFTVPANRVVLVKWERIKPEE